MYLIYEHFLKVANPANSINFLKNKSLLKYRIPNLFIELISELEYSKIGVILKHL